MFKKSFLLVSASSFFLVTPDAWAVPVDSFDCTFTSRDSDNKEIASNQMRFDIARRPRISTTDFQETEGNARLVTRLPDGWSFRVDLSIEHASNSVEGYQRANSTFAVCMPPPPSGKSTCMPSPRVVYIPPSGAGPYFSWRRIAVINGLPQFEPSEIATISSTMSIDGREARMHLACEYRGLTE